MNALEAKIPPPLVALITGLFMWLSNMWLSNNTVSGIGVPEDYRVILAVAIVLLGVSCDLGGLISFRMGKTTINPMRPETSSNLIIAGIYKITRNPMYLGLAIILTGWAVYLSNLLLLAWVVAFIAYITRFQIQPEERALDKLFGDEFANYKLRVRRWF
jgi:protein-S-isoprenylcysteine O-methyltransferase Ste14